MCTFAHLGGWCWPSTRIASADGRIETGHVWLRLHAEEEDGQLPLRAFLAGADGCTEAEGIGVPLGGQEVKDQEGILTISQKGK